MAKLSKSSPGDTPPPTQPGKPWRTEGLKNPEVPDNKARGSKKTPKWMIWVVWGLILVGIFAYFSYQDRVKAGQTISYTEFAAQLNADNVEKIYARGDTIQGELRNEAPVPQEEGSQRAERNYKLFTTERPTFADDKLLDKLNQNKVEVSAEPVVAQRGILMNLLLSILPWLLLIAVWIWFFRKISAGGKFGLGMSNKTSKPVDTSKVRVTFDDVAGIDEVEDQLREVVDYLRNTGKYERLGARAPRGILLTGQPGTGKTLLARATAGEADVPFFSASASEFIEMIVGVGAQRVRELFDEARKVAPAIIFIDEIDTIGRSRAGNRSLGGSDEREQTLNQILTEMDGFSGTEGIIVLAATNRPDVLDSALTRPGRFDRQIQVSSPDRVGREKIMEVHVRGIPLAEDVSLAAMAKATPGMTGADLANLCNEAALQAARRDANLVTHADFMQALEQVQLGIARSVVMPEEEKRRTAYHESGHALLGMLCKGADPVRKISIIPRGRALGVTLSTPEDDKYGYDEEYLRGRIVGALGGMAAEEGVFNIVTTGAESDLQHATAIARQMAGRWGMSPEVGPITVLSNDDDPRMMGISDQTLAQVDKAAREIIMDCQERARAMLRENRDKLDSLAEALLEAETLDEAEAYAAAGVPRVTHEESHVGQPETPVLPDWDPPSWPQ